MKAHSPRQALDIAVSRDCLCVATHPRRIKTRSSAEAKVPRGGLLVREDDGTFVALALQPVPDHDPDAAALARHLQSEGRHSL